MKPLSASTVDSTLAVWLRLIGDERFVDEVEPASWRKKALDDLQLASGVAPNEHRDVDGEPC